MPSYRRSRFSTELPADYRYTPAHFWLREESSGVWRIGFTKFALWLLGDPVEFDFSVNAGQPVAAGREIGWVEGLKALTTIYAAAEGEFLGAGGEIRTDITLLDSDPYERGCLYRIRGKPVSDSLDVNAYMAVLDEAVDRVIAGRQQECGGDCEGM